MCEKFHQLGGWFPPGTPVSSTRKLISSSSFHRLDMTLAVAEALNPNKPNQTSFFFIPETHFIQNFGPFVHREIHWLVPFVHRKSLCGAVCIPANSSAFCGIFPHLNHVFCIPYSSQNITESKILQFYRISIDSHQIDVKSLIQGLLSLSKDYLWALCCVPTLMVRVRQGQRERD